jgi:hypothetical protein
MTLTNNTKFNVVPLLGTVPEAALVEPGVNEAEAVPVTLTSVADSIDWTYSATAEDNGTAGILDGQPGVIYNGPSGNHVRVAMHAITLPEATDTAALAVFVNSEVRDYGDEGFNTHAAEIAVENNIDTVVVLNEGDVLRVGMSFNGEADADLDLAPGEITIT